MVTRPPARRRMTSRLSYRLSMRVGIIILADERWSVAQRRWRLAEEYGFAHAWTYDHICWRDLVDGPWFGAVPTLTAAATATQSMRLGTLLTSVKARSYITGSPGPSQVSAEAMRARRLSRC